MSINSCQISSHSINAICKYRKKSIIDSLLPPTAAEEISGSVQKVNPYYAYRHSYDQEIDVTELELPQIRVTIILNGKTYFEVLDRADSTFVPAISISNMQVEYPQIRIFDIKVN